MLPLWDGRSKDGAGVSDKFLISLSGGKSKGRRHYFYCRDGEFHHSKMNHRFRALDETIPSFLQCNGVSITAQGCNGHAVAILGKDCSPKLAVVSQLVMRTNTLHAYVWNKTCCSKGLPLFSSSTCSDGSILASCFELKPFALDDIKIV